MGSVVISQQYVCWYVGHHLLTSHHANGSSSQFLQLIELFSEHHQISARTGESIIQHVITVLFLEVLNISEKWFNTLTLSQLQNFILFYLLPKNPDFWPIFEYQQISSLLFSRQPLLIFLVHEMYTMISRYQLVQYFITTKYPTNSTLLSKSTNILHDI